jgi:two-component system CheB/CheR fusion protein
MPASAIAAGAVDVVASVQAIPGHILAALQTRGKPDAPAELPPEQTDAARLAICAVLQRQLGHDFSGYKKKTFLRRVQRRMQVVNLPTLDEYAARLDGDRAEVRLLLRDLLIGVTSFFRDADTFAVLKQTVVPRLFEGKGADAELRVWVPGCATGEEAYSLAMLLREHADELDRPAPKMQVFATDIDELAVATARAGRYPSTLLEGVSPERLSRFFVAGIDGSYTVSREVREFCTFSAHSLTRNPPFSRIDLLSCRNLLIYLDTDLQETVIPAFHYALVPNGILLLGSSESVTRHEDLFATLDRANRIFQRRDVPSPSLHLTGGVRNGEPQPTRNGAAFAADTSRAAILRIGGRASARVLERFGPAFVVASAAGEIVQYSSGTGRFLEPAPGLASQNVLVMARRGMAAHLRAALKQAVETGRPVEKPDVSVAIPGEGNRRVTLAVEPMREQGPHTLYLIMFVEPGRQKGESKAVPADEVAVDAGPDRHIEMELRETREQLQSITEEHETALEELRSSNEELLSVNEELQSSNEELETSKEEIQSINEELQTVNGQLAAKVDELDHKNTDLKNLFESTQVATIFLDRYLVVRGFTPAVANIYNLIPGDIGRPLTDIVSRLRYAGLREDIHQVLMTLEPLERRVARDDDSTHYLMRVLPYRTPDSMVDGALVTFVDVTSIVQAEQHQRLLVDELNHRVKNMLTVVISMAKQTVRGSKSLKEFSETYMGRLHTLSATYGLLSNETWQSVCILDIIMEELGPFLATDRANITVEGPRVLLEARSALALGLAVHELTTNAVKYGALSVAQGSVSVRWYVEQDADGGRLALDWIEADGPHVAVPTRRGFGMTLIERGLKQDMSAEVDLEFAATGVKARIRAPLRTRTGTTADATAGS